MFKSQNETEHIERRRELLKAKNAQGYQMEMSNRQIEVRLKMSTVTKLILAKVELPETAWPEIQKHYMTNA